MGKLALAVLLAVVAVHFSEGAGYLPKSPVRINPYVLKYLQGYYKKHKTLPPALKRWAYQQLQKRQVSHVPPVPVRAAPVQFPVPAHYGAPIAVPVPAVQPRMYVPPPLPVPAPAPQPAGLPAGSPQGKAGYGPPAPSYRPPTQHRPSYGNVCHGRVHAGWCHGKYAGHYTMPGTSSCYIQCDQWGRAYGKPCAPGTYWRYGGPEPAYYNHCA